MTYIRVSRCFTLCLFLAPLLYPLARFLIFFSLRPLTALCFLSCLAYFLPSFFCLSLGISDFYLPWHICAALARRFPFLLCPFVAFILGKDMPSAHTQTHSGEFTIFISRSVYVCVCVCASRVESSLVWPV